jgi:hypothetical protein
MKRVVSVIFSVLQLVLLAGIGVLLWLDKNSMGVMRYLANKNRIWNQASWTGWLLIAGAVAMTALLVWACLVLFSPKGKGPKRTWAVLAILSTVTMLFGLIAENGAVRPYYFICIILVNVTLLQAVKCVGMR